MGVKGLWTLLEPVGKPVTLESLEGKILAVDVSIWLHQTVHGMRDKHGDPVANAHLVGLFNRLCKLLFYKIRPIFVFDGGIPDLKRQTLAARRQQRADATERSEQATRKMLTGLLKQHAIGSALSGASGGLQAVPSGSGVRRTESADMYRLPPMPQTETDSLMDDEIERTLDMRATFLDMISEEFQDPEDIDPDSADFQALPAELRYELLKELGEHRKQRRWKNSVEMPEASDDFSNFQLKRMMNRSRLTQRLDHVRKEINESAEGDMVLSLTGSESRDGVYSQRLVSDETSHYILVKGLKNQPQVQKDDLKEKILGDVKKEEPKECNKSENGKVGGKFKSSENPIDTKHNYGSHNKNNRELSEEVKVSLDAEDTDSFIGDILPFDDKKDVNSAPGKSGLIKPCTSENINEPTLNVPSKSNSRSSKSTVTRVKSAGAGAHAAPPHTADTEIFSSGEESDVICVIPEENESKNDSHGGFSERQGLQLVNEHESDSIISNGVPRKDITNEGGFIHESSDEDALEPYEKKAIENTRSEKAPFENDRVESSKLDVSVNQVLSSHAEDATSELMMQTVRSPKSIDIESTTHVDLTRSTSSIVTEETRAVSSGADRAVGACPEPQSQDVQDQPLTSDADKSQLTVPEAEQQVICIVSSDPGDTDSDGEEFEEVAAVDHVALDEMFAVNRGHVNDSVPSAADHHADKEVDMASAPTTHTSGDVEPESVKPSLPEKPIPSKEDIEALEELQSQLEAESQTLQKERGRLDRQAASITDQMTVEAQELLRLFGVPYMVGPMEAEAQCAHLDLTSQTEGTVTDDSDIWLFGGRRVYKNMFNHGKYVEFFNQNSIQSQLMLDRDKLINIAYLCGSDYTTGIERVGPVTAMEVLAEFPGDGIQQLRNMKKWWNLTQNKCVPPSTDTKVKQKVRQLKIPSGFPSLSVAEAYLKPEVDDSEERFTWGKPDLDLLRTYALQKLGWSQTKTDESLLPVIKKLSETSLQRHITSFFGMDFGEPRKLKSKRVKNVVNRLQDKNRASNYASSTPTPTAPEAPYSKSPVSKGKPPCKSGGKGRDKSSKRSAPAAQQSPDAKRAKRGRGGRGRMRGRPHVPSTSGGRQTVAEVALSESSSDEN